MALSNLNPITIQNMIYNVLAKAGSIGRAVRIAKVTGTVIGIPQDALDVKGLRNLINKTIVLSPDDDKAVLLVHENAGALTSAFSHPDHDSNGKILNSLFVLVETEPGAVPKVCLNLAVLNAPS